MPESRMIRRFKSKSSSKSRGGSRIFLRRGVTRLLLYFNTNKPHSFLFFLQNTSCIRKPQVISGGVRTPCTLPLDPPLGLFLENVTAKWTFSVQQLAIINIKIATIAFFLSSSLLPLRSSFFAFPYFVFVILELIGPQKT